MEPKKTLDRELERGALGDGGAEPEFRVDDRRHWSRAADADAEEQDEPQPRQPGILEEHRHRAEQAEARLQEYIAAFKNHQQEQDAFRARLGADVERRVALRFGEIVTELLETMDDLDRGLAHAGAVPEAEPLVHGLSLTRERFLATLGRHGVEELDPRGRPFDPNEAEALRVDPVDDPELDGVVTETLRPGYRLEDRVLRAAQVAVGRLTAPGDGPRAS